MWSAFQWSFHHSTILLSRCATGVRQSWPATSVSGTYLDRECERLVFKNSVRTSQETHYASTTKADRLMLFRITVAVYFENHTEHTDALCGQNAKFLMLKLMIRRVTTVFKGLIYLEIPACSIGLLCVTCSSVRCIHRHLIQCQQISISGMLLDEVGIDLMALEQRLVY
jgi:hypothetical protein